MQRQVFPNKATLFLVSTIKQLPEVQDTTGHKSHSSAVWASRDEATKAITATTSPTKYKKEEAGKFRGSPCSSLTSIEKHQELQGKKLSRTEAQDRNLQLDPKESPSLKGNFSLVLLR